MAGSKNGFWFDVFVKEGTKKLVWYVLALAAVLGIVIFDYFYEFPVPIAVRELPPYPFISNFVRHNLAPLADFFRSHPYSSASLLLISSIIVSLIAIIVHLNRKIRELPENSHLNAGKSKLIESVGLIQRWPNTLDSVNSDGSPWKQMNSEILNPKNNILKILGANGERAFGDISSPLHQAILNFRGDLRVILLDPNCKETALRANAVNIVPKDYQKSINKSKSFLKKLFSQGRVIKGRFYNGRPNWKMIITNESAWVQYYIPGGPDVEKTPIYVFENIGDPESFYNIFSKEFERIWDRCNNNSFLGN